MSIKSVAYRLTNPSFRFKRLLSLGGFINSDYRLHAFRHRAQPQTALAVAAMIRNEGRYLREWIEFHRMMGAERFILYDNDSDDDTADVLAPYVAEGIVSVIPWPHTVRWLNTQALAFAHAIRWIGETTEWIAFIDVDEFLFSPTGATLTEMLKTRRENVSSVYVSWRMFGTCGHENPPEGLVIENYLERWNETDCPPRSLIPIRFKAIVRPMRVRAVHTCHHFGFDNSKIVGYDENGRQILPGDAQRRPLPCEQFRLHHYFARSMESIRRRLNSPRGADSTTADKTKQAIADYRKLYSEMVEIASAHAVRDETLLPYAEELRRRVAS